MIVIGLVIAYLLGLSILMAFMGKDKEPSIRIEELAGLSFFIGIGLETVFMFIFDLIHLEINAFTLATLSLLLVAAIFFYHRDAIHALLNKIPGNYRFHCKETNFAWGILFLIVLVALCASALKSLFWPTAAYDSIAGYDLMGKAIATEGKLFVSLFKTGSAGGRAIYPPLVEGSFAYAYLYGMDSSKIITTFTYLSLLLTFYGLLGKYTTSLNAIFFTLLLVATPEMYSHSSMSLTNVPSAAYAVFGLLYIFIWFEKRQRFHFYVASLLLALNVWARNDGIVFNIAGLLLIGYYAVKNKSWKEVAIFSAITLAPFIGWTIYLKYKIGIVQDRFVTHLFWDSDRLLRELKWIKVITFYIKLYGLVFYIFIFSIVLNFKNVHRDKFALLTLILISFILYAGIFYQLDEVKQDPLDIMMQYSFKRGLFYFIPMVLFYSAICKPVRLFFEKIEKFRIGKA